MHYVRIYFYKSSISLYIFPDYLDKYIAECSMSGYSCNKYEMLKKKVCGSLLPEAVPLSRLYRPRYNVQ